MINYTEICQDLDFWRTTAADLADIELIDELLNTGFSDDISDRIIESYYTDLIQGVSEDDRIYLEMCFVLISVGFYNEE
jgi:hypothetical protein